MGLVVMIFFVTLNACEFEEETQNNVDVIVEATDTADKTDDVTNDENVTTNYSNDRTANTFITKFNELNPDNIIIEDMVSCPENSGIKLTIVKFEYMNLRITESDGSPAFICESVLEYSAENTEGFFKEAFYVIQATEEKMSDDDIEQVLKTLQDGEYPFFSYASSDLTNRIFTFRAPGDYRTIDGTKEKLSYQLSWNYATLY